MINSRINFQKLSIDFPSVAKLLSDIQNASFLFSDDAISTFHDLFLLLGYKPTEAAFQRGPILYREIARLEFLINSEQLASWHYKGIYSSEHRTQLIDEVINKIEYDCLSEGHSYDSLRRDYLRIILSPLSDPSKIEAKKKEPTEEAYVLAIKKALELENISAALQIAIAANPRVEKVVIFQGLRDFWVEIKGSDLRLDLLSDEKLRALWDEIYRR